jgi:hypothetical protein
MIGLFCGRKSRKEKIKDGKKKDDPPPDAEIVYRSI